MEESIKSNTRVIAKDSIPLYLAVGDRFITINRFACLDPVFEREGFTTKLAAFRYKIYFNVDGSSKTATIRNSRGTRDWVVEEA